MISILVNPALSGTLQDTTARVLLILLQESLPWLLYINNNVYCMALSHKDWELPNSRIWLAEMDIDRGLDFPI